MSREAADGSIENTFTLQLTNASEQARTYTVRVAGLPGLRLTDQQEITVPPAAIGDATLVLKVDADAAKAGAHPIQITIEDVANPKVSATEASKFWMP